MPKLIQIIMDDEQAAAVREHCRDKGVNLSEFIRDVLMRTIGRRDLIGAVKRGRPREDENSAKNP